MVVSLFLLVVVVVVVVLALVVVVAVVVLVVDLIMIMIILLLLLLLHYYYYRFAWHGARKRYVPTSAVRSRVHKRNQRGLAALLHVGLKERDRHR